MLTNACSRQFPNRSAETPPQAPNGRLQPIASVAQLHEAIITPASDTLFNFGTNGAPDEAAWTAVRNGAIVLAESGNLLMMAGRARDAGEWMDFSQKLAQGGAAAIKAAEARDMNALSTASDRIVQVCMACHQPYRDGGRQMGK